MFGEIDKSAGKHVSPFERIRRTNEAGNEYWSSRDFASILEYGDYRNFEAVIEKAKLACFNSGHRVEDHFVDVTEMIEIGKGGQRSVKTILMSRYACYLAIQNADPKKEIVALGQSYFAIQTRRQELADQELEDERRLMLRDEIRRHNLRLADAAKDAGVVEPIDYAIFQNHGLGCGSDFQSAAEQDFCLLMGFSGDPVCVTKCGNPDEHAPIRSTSVAL